MGSFIEGRNFGGENPQDQFLKEQLRAFLAGREVYKSADVPVLDDVTISPQYEAEVDVVLKPKDLPILEDIPVKALDFLKKSVKSRAAQSGLNIGGHSGTSRHIFTAGQKFAYSQELDGYIARVLVSNHSLRPILLRAGVGLYRYYYLSDTTRLQGENLVQAVETGAIQIGGSNWGFSGFENSSGEFTPSGLYVDIDPSTFRAVDPFCLVPLEVPENAPNFGRNVLDKHFRKPMNLPGGRRQLLIGETPHMKLASNVNIELKATTSKTNQGFDYPTSGRQINSCLLDGAITDHRVRVEIEDSANPSIGPHRVFMDAFQST